MLTSGTVTVGTSPVAIYQSDSEFEVRLQVPSGYVYVGDSTVSASGGYQVGADTFRLQGGTLYAVSPGATQTVHYLAYAV